MVTIVNGMSTTVEPEVNPLGEVAMVGRERWQEIHQLFREAGVPIAEIGRRLDLDRKTVRRCLRRATWQPYVRPTRPDTLLATHTEWLRPGPAGAVFGPDPLPGAAAAPGLNRAGFPGELVT